MTTRTPSETMDEAAHWARPFLRSLLDLWLHAATQPDGLFFPYLDRQWQRISSPRPLTLVSQCRVIYNFCRGWELFQEVRYAEAASHGLTALERCFRLAPGRYRWAVTPQGLEASAAPDAYGHAFVILALATAARTLNDRSLAQEALVTWDGMKTVFGEAQGGLIWRPQGPHQEGRSQNPLMHTFEALMALLLVDESGQAQAGALETLTFLRSLTDFRSGRLLEMFTSDWQPPQTEEGEILLGHQFEWATLLSDWHTITGEQDALRQGQRFLHTGITWGLDTDGGVWEGCRPTGQAISRTKGLWQQCEGLRALCRYATHHNDPAAAAAFVPTWHLYQQRFVDTAHGGLFAQPPGLGADPNWNKGDAWKLDYHSVNLCLELIAA